MQVELRILQEISHHTLQQFFFFSPKIIILSDNDIGEPELWTTASNKLPWFLTHRKWTDSLQVDKLMQPQGDCNQACSGGRRCQYNLSLPFRSVYFISAIVKWSILTIPGDMENMKKQDTINAVGSCCHTQAPLLKNGYFHNTGKLKLSILQYISNKKTNQV